MSIYFTCISKHLNKFAQSRISAVRITLAVDLTSKGCMRHTEAAEETQAKSDVTLMPFSFQRSVNSF